MEGFLADLEDEAYVIYLGKVKVGEDISTRVPTVIQDTPNTIQQLLPEPLTFQESKRKYYGRKTKTIAHCSTSYQKLNFGNYFKSLIWCLIYQEYILKTPPNVPVSEINLKLRPEFTNKMFVSQNPFVLW